MVINKFVSIFLVTPIVTAGEISKLKQNPAVADPH
jgi:hypothetical protein